jgi:BASS family bile acid:Na+ symporter
MELLVDIGIPLVVVTMMLVVGLQLTLEDFRRIRSNPRPVLVGTAGQLIVLPVIAAGLAWALEPPAYVVAGMLLVAACPGAAISNYYVYLARADVALSVTLTALSTVLAFVSLPLVVNLSFQLLLERQESVAVPVFQMIAQLFLVLLLPTVAGMWIRQRFAALVQSRAALFRRVSIGALVALIAFVIQDQAHNLAAQIGELLVTAVLFSLFAMLAGAATAWGLAQTSEHRFAFMVEYATRNLGIATVVGATLLGHTELVVFAAAFFLIQVPLMLAAVTLQRMKSGDTTAS